MQEALVFNEKMFFYTDIPKENLNTVTITSQVMENGNPKTAKYQWPKTVEGHNNIGANYDRLIQHSAFGGQLLERRNFFITNFIKTGTKDAETSLQQFFDTLYKVFSEILEIAQRLYYDMPSFMQDKKLIRSGIPLEKCLHEAIDHGKAKLIIYNIIEEISNPNGIQAINNNYALQSEKNRIKNNAGTLETKALKSKAKVKKEKL